MRQRVPCAVARFKHAKRAASQESQDEAGVRAHEAAEAAFAHLDSDGDGRLTYATYTSSVQVSLVQIKGRLLVYSGDRERGKRSPVHADSQEEIRRRRASIISQVSLMQVKGEQRIERKNCSV